jgi:hypothetical protein
MSTYGIPTAETKEKQVEQDATLVKKGQRILWNPKQATLVEEGGPHKEVTYLKIASRNSFCKKGFLFKDVTL